MKLTYKGVHSIYRKVKFAVYIQLSLMVKAFDKVPHIRLMYKLDYYGIRGYTHKWITS